MAFRGTGGGELGKSTVAKGAGVRGRGATAHGFRLSFGMARTSEWQRLFSELALAYIEGSRTVAAYARDDLLEQRLRSSGTTFLP